mgnify:CR=1 FL=1
MADSDDDPTPKQIAQRKAAYDLLEQAIAALVEAFRPEGSETDIPVDAVLLVGLQNVDSDVDRVGAVCCYPRHGSQPTYITHGLIARADALLRE